VSRVSFGKYDANQWIERFEPVKHEKSVELA
jgi:hypothetical protein